jgi:hypothetical protein
VAGWQAWRVASAGEAAVSYLHQELEWVSHVRDDHAGEAWPEREGRVSGSVGALGAVGLITEREAEAWRARLLATGEEQPEELSTARAASEGLLEELFDALGPSGGTGGDVSRFQGALGALRALGATEAGWNERLRRRMGWPSAAELRERHAGGAQEELLAVLAGPADAVDGVRVPYALRFSDGITFLIRREAGFREDADDDWWDVELVDDLGTRYAAAGGGGGAAEMWLSFRTAAPAEAKWVELRGAASEPIRIAL